MSKSEIKDIVVMIIVALALLCFFLALLWVGLKLNISQNETNTFGIIKAKKTWKINCGFLTE